MVKPILYALDTSAPCRSVLLTGAAIGIEYEIRDVNLSQGEHLKDDFIKMNPQHTIPTLDDNGFILWDSHAIMCYLVDKYAKNDALYPKDLQKRALVNQRLYFEDGYLFDILKSILKPVIFQGVTTIPKDRVAVLEESYSFLDGFLEGKKWLAGDSYTLADISCVTTVSSAIVVKPVDNYPNVKAWLQRCESELPGYATLNTPGNNKFITMIREKLSI